MDVVVETFSPVASHTRKDTTGQHRVETRFGFSNDFGQDPRRSIAVDGFPCRATRSSIDEFENRVRVE